MTSPITLTGPATGSKILSSFGGNIATDINLLLTPPIFQGYQAAAQSIPNATWTTIAIDTEVFDSANGHSTTVNNTRYTAAVAGYYEFVMKVGHGSNATGDRGAGFQVNSGGIFTPAECVVQAVTVATHGTQVVAVCKFQLAAGGFVEGMGYQNSGGALSTLGSGSMFEARLISY